MDQQPIYGYQAMKGKPSILLDLLAFGSLPVMILLSILFFETSEGGQEKFGIAIIGLLILTPLGALVSFICSFYRRRLLLRKNTWPHNPPGSIVVVSLLIFVCVAIATVSLMGLGDLLGFYGILGSWVGIWLVGILALNYRS